MKKIYLLHIIILLLLIPVITLSQNQFWALTNSGGAYGYGALINVNSNGTGLTVTHSFQPPGGYQPLGDLLQASDGNIYGTCFEGGSFGSCTIFKFNPFTNTYTDVYDFDIVHGDYPRSGVMEGPSGKLYGVASMGGANQVGVIYSFDIMTNNYSVIYDFNYTAGTGYYPFGTPVLHSNGKLYGLTSAGGTGSLGVLYCYDIATNTYTDLVSFTGALNGAVPYGSLIEANNGKLFGMTNSGGLNNKGTIFNYDPVTSTITTLHSFNNADGSAPWGNLTLASNGFLYGMTTEGGINTYGVIYKLDISNNAFTKLYDFTAADGALPNGSLFEYNGVLLGATKYGGAFSKGAVFNYNLLTNTYIKVLDFNGINGANPTGGFIKYSPTGINAFQSANDKIQVFPNPCSGQLYIDWKQAHVKQAQFTMTDIAGRQIYPLRKTFTANRSVIDLSAVKKGEYFIKVDTGKETLTKKIIKE